MGKHTFRRLLPALLIAALAAGAGISESTARGNNFDDSATARNMKLFSYIMRTLDNSFVDTIDSDDITRAAIDAMLYKLDPYTQYFNEKENLEFGEETNGEYGGIGIRLGTSRGHHAFGNPEKGSPADRAGLRSGDRIVKIDSVEIKPETDRNKVLSMLRGEPGSQVTVSVVRPYTPDSLKTFTLTREKLHMPAVSYSAILPDGIGYIQLGTFSAGAAAEIEKILKEFKQDPNLKGVVIDLQQNGGGLLSEAVSLAGFFVPRRTHIVTTRGRSDEVRREYQTPREPVMPDIPLAVLIDGGSASASEVFAGAMQDLDRAILVGERSFGKGLVQTTQEAPDGGMLKYTVAKYYIPSGRLIQARDYSHRNEDGTPGYTPDSLTRVYHTRNGREVRDGGGLKPDISLPDSLVSPFIYSLLNTSTPSDFADKFAAEHPSIAPAAEFEISEEDYGKFKEFVAQEGFTYEPDASKYLKALRDLMKNDKVLTPDLTARIDSLESAMKPDLNELLDTNSQFLKELLSRWIASHYYYTAGGVENGLKYEKPLIEARDILLDRKRYDAILSGKEKPEKKK